MFEINSSLVLIIAILIPVVSTCLVVLFEPWLKKQDTNGVGRYLSFLIAPPALTPLDMEGDTTLNQSEKREHLKSQLLRRIGLMYMIVVLFIICNFVAEFYYVAGDLLETQGQGGTDRIRTWSSIIISGPFTSGWMGDLPWYGHIPLPPLGANIFHEPWNWRFFTAAIVDNPLFFPSTFEHMLTSSVITGIIFLLPLILKSVRNSIVPSLFFLTSGMLIMTRSAFAAFGQSFRLLYGGETITYGMWDVTIAVEQLQGYVLESLTVNTALIIGMFGLILLLGYKLSKNVYPENQRMRKWILISITAIYWISLMFNVVML